MENRREFLKGAATGAVLLGAQGKLALAAALEAKAGQKSKVVIARDESVHGTGAQPDEQKVLALLDKAMAAYTGREKPSEQWKHVIPPAVLKSGVIGLKVNGLGSKGIATHSALVFAVAERLQQIGVKPGNILAFDSNAHYIESCGLTISNDPSRVRAYGNDKAGFDDEESVFGTANIRLSKILSEECAMVINLPILKDHEGAGVTFAMKNMYGVVDRPDHLHAGGCNPGVADLNCIPIVRDKVRFIIGDALSSVYNGGPGFRPQHLWYPNALIVGEDRVAVDYTAWQMIERKRAEVGMPTLEAAGRPPRYITTAADAAHGLGTNDPERIHLVEI